MLNMASRNKIFASLNNLEDIFVPLIKLESQSANYEFHRHLENCHDRIRQARSLLNTNSDASMISIELTNIAIAAQEMVKRPAFIKYFSDRDISKINHAYITLRDEANLKLPAAVENKELIGKADEDFESRRLASLQSAIVETENKLEAVQAKFDHTAEQVEELNRFIANHKAGYASEFDVAKQYIIHTTGEFTNLVSANAGSILTDKYTSEAAKEIKVANIFRYISIAIMSLSTCIVAHTLLIPTNGTFSIDHALTRLALVSFMLIPAAYLAKEAAKHRDQHYNHLQKIIDLSAMGPYVSTLPKHLQDLLKAKMAERLFGNQRNSKDSDSFPTTSHDFLMKFMDQLDTKKSDDKEKDQKGI